MSEQYIFSSQGKTPGQQQPQRYGQNFIKFEASITITFIATVNEKSQPTMAKIDD